MGDHSAPHFTIPLWIAILACPLVSIGFPPVPFWSVQFGELFALTCHFALPSPRQKMRAAFLSLVKLLLVFHPRTPFIAGLLFSYVYLTAIPRAVSPFLFPVWLCRHCLSFPHCAYRIRWNFSPIGTFPSECVCPKPNLHLVSSVQGATVCPDFHILCLCLISSVAFV